MGCLNQVSKEVKDHSVQPDSSNDLVSHNESQLHLKSLKIDGKYMDTLKAYVDNVKSEPIRNIWECFWTKTSFLLSKKDVNKICYKEVTQQMILSDQEKVDVNNLIKHKVF